MAAHQGRSMTEARAPLAGLKVLDLTYVWAGPGTGMYLLAASPQVAANAMMATQTHPVWGEVRMMAPPFSLSRSGWSTPPAAPHLGEHSEAVLEELGYDREQVEELRA